MKLMQWSLFKKKKKDKEVSEAFTSSMPEGPKTCTFGEMTFYLLLKMQFMWVQDGYKKGYL